MICHRGGFPTIHHDEIRDVTASLLTEVCHNVATEPHLQPVDNELMNMWSANVEDRAHLDIRARGFWNTNEDAFFDVRVFHPNTSSYRFTEVSSVYKRHEEERIWPENM